MSALTNTGLSETIRDRLMLCQQKKNLKSQSEIDKLNEEFETKELNDLI